MARQTKVQKLEEQLARMEEQFRKQKEAIEEQKKVLLRQKYAGNDAILARVAKEASRKNIWLPEGSEKDILELLIEYYGTTREEEHEAEPERQPANGVPVPDVTAQENVSTEQDRHDTVLPEPF